MGLGGRPGAAASGSAAITGLTRAPSRTSSVGFDDDEFISSRPERTSVDGPKSRPTSIGWK